MALVAWPGAGLIWPHPLSRLNSPPAISATATIDATGEKIAMVGRVRWTDYGSHDIRTVGWRAGAITSAGGSGIVLSLQDVDTTAGAPSRPDGTQDQTKAVLLSALTASAWNTQTLTTDRTIAHGAPLAVVWEFDGAGRLGADAMATIGMSGSSIDLGAHTILNTGTWSEVAMVSVLVLVASDGTIGSLGLSIPCTTVTTHTINSASAADEVANQFVLSAPATIEGITLTILFTDGGDVSLVLYDGTTAVETIAIDEDVGPVIFINSAKRIYFPFSTPRDLVASTVYRIGVKPTTANNISVYSFDVQTASYLDLFGGQAMHYWDRVDAGAWANENTARCLLMALHFSKTDVGGGGGMLTGAGTSGGMRG